MAPRTPFAGMGPSGWACPPLLSLFIFVVCKKWALARELLGLWCAPCLLLQVSRAQPHAGAEQITKLPTPACTPENHHHPRWVSKMSLGLSGGKWETFGNKT